MAHDQKPYSFENFPAELRNSKLWVTWRLEDSDKRQRCKSPLQAANPHKGASSTNPAHWASLEVAIKNQPQPTEKYKSEPHSSGVGCVIADEYVGVDFDHVLDLGSGTIERWAHDLLAALPPTYTEITPSESGLHAWFKCPTKGERESKRGADLEVYVGGRYFTVTGWRFSNTPADIAEITEAQLDHLLDAVEKRKKQEKKIEADDKKGFTSGRLHEYMTRHDFPDVSRAVQSLVVMLAYKHSCDEQKIDADFRESAIFKNTHWGTGKWERLSKKETAKAIAFVKEHPRTTITEGSSELIVIRGDEAEPEHLRFLWKPYLPLGKLAHFGGAQSQAKSPVTVDLAARVTRGAPWPDSQTNDLGPRSVILLNIEDDLSDTILPRFILAGGDRSKLFYVKGTKFTKEDKSAEMMLALDRDITLLCDLARKTPDLGLIVIDPISNYLGRVKMNAEEQVRTILTPLATLAAELGIVVVTVGHLNRREKGTSPLNRMMGAAAFSGVARVVYIFGPSPDSESPYSHLISAARGAVGDDSLIFHTEMQSQEWAGKSSDVIKVIWDGTSKATAEDAVDPASRKEKSVENDLANELGDLLKDGKPRSPEECKAHVCRTHSVKEDQVNWPRVRKKAKVNHERLEGKNKHVWQLEAAQVRIF